MIKTLLLFISAAHGVANTSYSRPPLYSSVNGFSLDVSSVSFGDSGKHSAWLRMLLKLLTRAHTQWYWTSKEAGWLCSPAQRR